MQMQITIPNRKSVIHADQEESRHIFIKKKKRHAVLHRSRKQFTCTKMKNDEQFNYTEIQLKAVFSHLDIINWDS